jgi:16S rRNA (guanine527-N7)-methyltransferase
VLQQGTLQAFRVELERRADSGVIVSPEEAVRLTQFYGLVLKWNPALNLTTLTSPGEFAARHIVEPLLAVRQLVESVDSLWDLGSGMGVPGIPVAVVRNDIRVRLIEAKLKRSVFLEEAANALGLRNVDVVNRRIEKMEPAGKGVCVAARAIEEMEGMLGELFRIGAGADQILLFLGSGLADRVAAAAGSAWEVERIRMPDSHSRYLVNLRRGA